MSCNCAKKSAEKWQKMLLERELKAKYEKELLAKKEKEENGTNR